MLADFFAALAGYLERHMDAGRLRQIDPVTALQALLGPLLLYLVIRPEFWQAAGGSVPPEQTVTEFVRIWLRGMAPEPPAE